MYRVTALSSKWTYFNYRVFLKESCTYGILLLSWSYVDVKFSCFIIVHYKNIRFIHSIHRVTNVWTTKTYSINRLVHENIYLNTKKIQKLQFCIWANFSTFHLHFTACYVKIKITTILFLINTLGVLHFSNREHLI